MRESLSRNSDAGYRRRYRRRRPLAYAAAALVLALALLGTWVFVFRDGAEPEPRTAAVDRDAVAGTAAETGAEPLRQIPDLPRPSMREARGREPQFPLPPLDESDAEIGGALTELLGADPVETWLDAEDVIRNAVVTIDNLPRLALALEQRPLNAVPGELVTSGEDDALVLDEANFDRYTPFVELVEDLDAATVVGLYDRYRPLFTDAYRDLGYPEGDFDARLVEVIDHLLTAPAVEGPIRLAQPSVMYEFADESLEQSSAGHKLMIRIGPDNAAAIKRKLRELRAVLTGGVAGTGRPEPPPP